MSPRSATPPHPKPALPFSARQRSDFRRSCKPPFRPGTACRALLRGEKPTSRPSNQVVETDQGENLRRSAAGSPHLDVAGVHAQAADRTPGFQVRDRPLVHVRQGHANGRHGTCQARGSFEGQAQAHCRTMLAWFRPARSRASLCRPSRSCSGLWSPG